MRKYIQIVILLSGVLWTSHSLAQTTRISNVVVNGNWSNSSTWSNGEPSSGDDVTIANGAVIILDKDVIINNLNIGTSNGGTTARLIISDGHSLTVNGGCNIFRGGTSGGNPLVKSIVIGSLSYEMVYDEEEDEDVEVEIEGTGVGAKAIIQGDLTIRGSLSGDFSGIRMIGEAQLELAGNMILPQNGGFLNAPSTAAVILKGISQQIYMGGDTKIEYPNLVVDGSSVEIIGNVGGRTGYVGGDLIVRNGGVFNNSGRQMKVNVDILVEEGASFHLSGGATISVDNETQLFLNGTLITEHIAGLDGFNPVLGIDFGDNAEIVYRGIGVQRAGFTDFVAIDTFPRLVFENSSGVNLDASVLVKEVNIRENAIFNGIHNGNTDTELTVVAGWTNSGTFNGQTGTVRLAGTTSTLIGTGVNNFHNLIIDSGVDFSAPQILTVSGSLIVNSGGSFIHNEGRVVFAQPSASRGTSGVGQFWDVTIVGGLNFDGQDTINHALYLQTGGISSINGTLALDLNTGYINPEGNGGLNGNLTFIKSASKKGYTAVSFPVGASVSDLKSAGFEYVFRYDDKAAPHYLVPLSNATALAADGKAYACHSAETNSSNPIIRVSGTYDNTRATVSVPVVSTPVNGQFAAGYTGWNLIGNPFAFDVDWDELLEVSGNTAIYRGIYYQMGDQFQPYIDGVPATGNYNRLSPMQGVMVYLPNSGNTPINNTFTFSKEAGLGSSNILRRKVQPTNVLKLNVSNGQYSDATYVRLSSDATVGFDPDMDAYKFRNGGSVPSFFSYKDGVNYSINSVPDMFAKYSILLAFEPKVAGTYTITLSEEYTYDLPYEIYLEDKVLNVMHPIGIDQSYTFSTNLEERSGRFTLHFENAVITAMEGINSGFVRVFSKGRDVTLTGADIEEAADVRLYDVAGRMIAEYNKVDLHNKTFSFKVGTTPGVYIVNIVAGEKIRSERVVIY